MKTYYKYALTEFMLGLGFSCVSALAFNGVHDSLVGFAAGIPASYFYYLMLDTLKHK